MSAPQVKVTQGIMEGRMDYTPAGKKYYSFEGIPYAKPPVGKLRFHDPQQPEDWIGIRDATKPGNMCSQIDPYRMQPIQGSEDCLYLNIYTPVLEKTAKLPVIFFIHGGRYLVGYGDYYKPDYFVEKNAILVTVNYRLNILGFLCLDIPQVPGNAGMKDTVFALKWVRENVWNFGGDSNNVTIFGESSGAGTSAAFLTSKMCDGLYDKIICMSGNSLFDLFMVDNPHTEMAERVSSLLGNNTKDPMELYRFLQGVNVDDLVQAVCAIQLSRPQINAIFLPVVEKRFDGVVPFFTETPVLSLSENRFSKVPILVGYSSHEGALFLPRDFEGNYMYQDLDFFIPMFSKLSPDSKDGKKLVSKLNKYYFDNRSIGDDVKLEYVDLLTDAFFLRDTIRFVDRLSQYHSDVWMFRYSFEGSMATRIMRNMGLRGAAHSDILPNLFYRKNKTENLNDDDKNIMNVIIDIWTNFARTGSPSWKGQNVEWTNFSHTNQCCLSIDKKLSMMEYPEKDRIDMWMRSLSEFCKSKL